MKTRTDQEIMRAVERAVKRIKMRVDERYWNELLFSLVKNNAIPLELLEFIPLKARDAGKTRFDT
jgi:hypothetical protein